MENNKIDSMRKLAENMKLEGQSSRSDCVTELCDAIEELKNELQTLRDQKPYAWELPSIPPRIVLHPDFNANYGGTVKPLYAAAMPAREGWKLVPIEPTEEMLRAECEDGLNWYSIAGEIYKAMLEASPKE